MLKFGFTYANKGLLLRTEFDNKFAEDIGNYDSAYERRIAIGRKAGSIIHETIHERGIQVLSFDFSVASRKRKPEQARLEALTAVEVLMSVCKTPTTSGDRLLKVAVGDRPNGESHLPMSALVTWPMVAKSGLTSESKLEKLTGQRMRAIAQNVGYLRENTPKEHIDLIQASISRQHGVTLDALVATKSSLVTDDKSFVQDAPEFELNGQNIFSRAQQLVLLAGVIAIAHADELLSPQS